MHVCYLFVEEWGGYGAPADRCAAAEPQPKAHSRLRLLQARRLEL